MSEKAGLIFLRSCVAQGRMPDMGDLRLILRDFAKPKEENEALKQADRKDGWACPRCKNVWSPQTKQCQMCAEFG